MTNTTPTMQTDWVARALGRLEGMKDTDLPDTLSFLPTSANDRPDSDSSSLRGVTTINTPEQRNTAITTLKAMQRAPA